MRCRLERLKKTKGKTTEESKRNEVGWAGGWVGEWVVCEWVGGRAGGVGGWVGRWRVGG